MLLQIQLDPTEIIQSAAEVRPDGSGAYGWLIVVILAVMIASVWFNFLQYKRLGKEQDKRGEMAEKFFGVVQTQGTLIERVDTKLTELNSKTDTNTALIQTLINK